MPQKNGFWRGLWALIKPYWTSEDKWMAFLLLGLILACEVFQVRIAVIINSWRKHFYDSLQAFNMHFVLISMMQFVFILFLAILIFTYDSYFQGILIVRWRKWMTEKYVKKWLDDHVAYAMQILNKNMDNPDQRISEDLNELPTYTLNLLTGFFNSILTLISFSVILWSLSGALIIPFNHHLITIPGYMFYATLLYATIGTIITSWIGINLIKLNYQQEQFNANFRFGLIRVRESTEQIAMYRGENNERHHLMALFSYVYQNFFAIIRLQKNLNFFVNGYNLSTQVVGILIALPRYMRERLLLGSLIQVLTAFEQVVGALSFIVNSFTTIANWRAVIWRLNEFNRLMNEAANETNRKQLTIKSNDHSVITAEQLSLMLPNHDILVRDLNFSINPGQHSLITGRYGSGKSTLLRAMADIWPYGSGSIALPSAKKLFLPQRPYFPLGTLREAILYPEQNTHISDEQICTVLEECGLPKLKERLNEMRYWSAEFSLGEQQLIAFARVFLVEPQWLFLDEATSALDEETEARMYQLLQTRFPAMTIISVGHRSSLKAFHSREINIHK
jgi:vitamin B12/bleomycin/antimicrobial peptide transport system ATP-binding/permease protein